MLRASGFNNAAIEHMTALERRRAAHDKLPRIVKEKYLREAVADVPRQKHEIEADRQHICAQRNLLNARNREEYESTGIVN